MKYRLALFLTIAICFLNSVSFAIPIINGKQPNSAIDVKGVIRVVYGQDDNIYCITSKDDGQSFSTAVLVATIPNMHLGNTRGPQIASSAHYSMITAIDKSGEIHSFKLDHSKNVWTATSHVNDQRASAPEGLMAITADKSDHFFAVWLDIRISKMNNIFFSTYSNATSWKPNKLVYRSPEGHVCECCKPNISWKDNKIGITFRNWLNGSRDIYYSISMNNGESFTKAIQSGYGTWKLKGCPMDGGGSAVDKKGVLSAAWQRNGEVFYTNSKLAEQKIGSGRGVSMAQGSGNTFIVWQENGAVQLCNLNSKKTMELGKGTSPRISVLPDGKAFCVWEQGDNVALRVFN
jgi:hypothetical protein